MIAVTILNGQRAVSTIFSGSIKPSADRCLQHCEEFSRPAGPTFSGSHMIIDCRMRLADICIKVVAENFEGGEISKSEASGISSQIVALLPLDLPIEIAGRVGWLEGSSPCKL